MPCASDDHTTPQWIFFSFSTFLQFDIQASYLLRPMPCLHYASSMQNHEWTIAQQMHSNLMKIHAVMCSTTWRIICSIQATRAVLHLSTLK